MRRLSNCPSDLTDKWSELDHEAANILCEIVARFFLFDEATESFVLRDKGQRMALTELIEKRLSKSYLILSAHTENDWGK